MRILFVLSLLLMSSCAEQKDYTYKLDSKPSQKLSYYDISKLAEKYVPNNTFDDRLEFIETLESVVSTASIEHGVRQPDQLDWDLVRLSNLLNVSGANQYGFYPYGYFEYDAYDGSFYGIKKHLEVNKLFYDSLRNSLPVTTNCLNATYESCIKKLAQKLVITTKAGTSPILRLPQRNINKKIIGENIGTLDIVVYVPNKSRAWNPFFLTLYFDPKTKKMNRIYVKSKVPFIRSAQTESDYDDTNYYELISAISEKCPDRLTVYKQINSIFKNSITYGREYSSSVSSASISQSWYYKDKKVCDMKSGYSAHAGLFVGSSAGEWREEGLYLSK